MFLASYMFGNSSSNRNWCPSSWK